MVEQKEQKRPLSPEQAYNAYLQLISAWKSEETSRFLIWRRKFAIKAGSIDDDTLSQVLDLLRMVNIRTGLLLEKPFRVERDTDMEDRAGKIEEVKWSFITQAQSAETISSLIPPGLEINLFLRNLASQLGIDTNSVLDAVIKTEILISEFNRNSQPVFLKFGTKTGHSRIEDNFLVLARKERGKNSLKINVPNLEFYAAFPYKGRGDIPTLCLLIDLDLPEADFTSLFPEVLIFTSYFARQNSALSPEQ